MLNTFISKHNGIGPKQIEKMLSVVKVDSVKQLIEEVMPINYEVPYFRSHSEHKSLNILKNTVVKNENIRSLYGQGYHPNYLPAVVNRLILENPKWYTPYTPYQSEISQGRLESLYNFQTLIQELTDLPIANASLLDESITAVECLNMSKRYHKDKKTEFFCADDCHPQIIEVLKHRAEVLDINLVVDNIDNINITDNLFGTMIQYPNTYGNINNYDEIVKELNKNNSIVSCSSDILSLFLLKPPGSFGVDICFGTTQRLGSPMWFGGPHASFMAARKDLIRLMPGRIIGKSIDSSGDDCFRIALQTREQHIKKDKATSNICTAQALLANLTSMNVIYNGKDGILKLAQKIHSNTKYLANQIGRLGFKVVSPDFFDTIYVECYNSKEIVDFLLEHKIGIRDTGEGFCISLDDSIEKEDIDNIISLLKKFSTSPKYNIEYEGIKFQMRNNDFLNQSIFNDYTTEPKFTRYVYSLCDKDYGLTDGMIPLGSCTMKLNSVSELLPLSWEEMQNSHPYILNKSQGYLDMIEELGKMLCDITGFDDISYQSNSGAMGEYAGLLCIRKYHHHNGDFQRKKCLIPKSAHGTNFSSAQLCNLDIVKFDDDILIEDFIKLVEEHKNELFGLMVTYPNTYGIFPDNINEINDIIHKNGGLVYMDGANMNAQVGYTSPGSCGADVCHLNLHKTFCIPHGGGGPGMGPILVNEKLKPFLPKSFQVDQLETSVKPISSSEWSSASILSITYLYLKMMGSDGIKKSTQNAILNSNYIMERLKHKFEIAYINKNGRVGHEFIIDLRKYKEIGISENDIAKRLIDYSFHPPTMSWPIPGTIMIEPTESETLDELDRFCDAMLNIYQELEDIRNGKYEKDNNVFVNSPHTIKNLLNWKYPYTPEYACQNSNVKFWSSVGRVDNSYGDKLLLRK